MTLAIEKKKLVKPKVKCRNNLKRLVGGDKSNSDEISCSNIVESATNKTSV